jgi:hypothetical protein
VGGAQPQDNRAAGGESALGTSEEAGQSDERCRALTDLPGLADAEIVPLDDDALALAAAYIRDGAVGEAQRVDARHIAVATVQRVDVLVSWNFRHIVKLNRIRAFNARKPQIRLSGTGDKVSTGGDD